MNVNKRHPITAIAQELTPPLLWNILKRTTNSISRPNISHDTVPGTQQQASHYNEIYAESEEYRKHYTASQYYFLWCVVVDRLKRANCQAILDIGCGSGQFASMLWNAGIPQYVGLDFSETAIFLARNHCPGYRFVCESAFDTNLFLKYNYDLVISMEFLEHVDDDIAILNRIPSGKKFLGTVPSFPYKSHVRFFSGPERVAERYEPLFSQFRVDTILADNRGARYFLFDGVKN
ncbi:MAG: class I SAM-dependent methyltransferase [Thermoguttaceae bacterium]